MKPALFDDKYWSYFRKNAYRIYPEFTDIFLEIWKARLKGRKSLAPRRFITYIVKIAFVMRREITTV